MQAASHSPWGGAPAGARQRGTECDRRSPPQAFSAMDRYPYELKPLVGSVSAARRK